MFNYPEYDLHAGCPNFTFYLPLWSHWSPYLTRRHGLLHPMASGPLYLHLFLPNTPRQLLLNLQVATLVSL